MSDIGKFIDLTGQSFGRLVAISPTGRRGGDGSVIWLCKCECGELTESSANNLKRGITKSCGCYKRQRVSESSKKYNLFNNKGDVTEGTTDKGDKFLIDTEDLERIKQYYWCKNDQGYIVSNIGNNIFIRLHRFVMNVNDDRIIDHKNGVRTDNRKANLRVTDKQMNAINRGANINNKIGIKGVSKSKNGEKFTARISKNYKTIYIGTFDTIEEAHRARVQKEKELYGEFAYDDLKGVV